MNWQGKRVAVVGAGRSGLDAACALHRLGAQVTLYDRAEDTPFTPTLSPEGRGGKLKA